MNHALKEAFQKLGIWQRPVAVHASFKKVLPLCHTPQELVTILRDSFPTILMPAFTHDATVGAPATDRPQRNGIDYSREWISPRTPFTVERFPIDPRMGVTAKHLATLPDCQRSDHAWHSWLAWGEKSNFLIADHHWETTNLPLHRLSENEGWVLLIGVGLEACTAIHIAEERCGRLPFIRWAIDRQQNIRRVRACGCAKGFNNLLVHLDCIQTVHLGPLTLIAAPLETLIQQSAGILKSNPFLTQCSSSCIKCRDMIAGGVIL